MQLWIRLFLISLISQVVATAAIAADDVIRDTAEEIERRRAKVRDFYALRAATEAEAAQREKMADEQRRERQREEEQMERARLEYVRTRPTTDSSAEDERRDRLALQELERDEREKEITRREFIRIRARMREALRSGPWIDEMLEYDLNTERINRATRDAR